MKHLTFFLPIILFIQSCSPFNETENKINVLILYDFTPSLNESDLLLMTKKVNRLVNSLPDGSIFGIRPIDDNLYSELIWTDTITKPNDFMSPSEIEKLEQLNTAKADSLKQLLISFSSKKVLFESCVIESLRFARQFAKEETEEYDKYVVIFSDFIEECARGHSVFSEGLDVCDTNLSTDEIAGIMEEYEPEKGVPLADLLGDRLHLVVTSLPHDECELGQRSIEELVWPKVWEKHGYSDALEMGTELQAPFNQ